MTSLLVLLVGVLGAWLGGIVLLRLPGPIARPVQDRWHRKATPLTGGLALLAGLLLALSTAVLGGELDRRFAYVALAGTAACVLGFCDDERWLGPRAKFAGQLGIALAAATVIRPHWLPPAAGFAVTVFVLVAAMNSFNLLDNIDGLAAGTAAIATLALALTTLVVGGWAVRIVACAVAGACLGFLPLNYRPHRPAALFMGDSGAHLLGLCVGCCALLASPRGAGGAVASVLAPLLILALPILDTSLVILVRLAEHRPIWRGGRDHLSHRLVYVGLGERQAVAALLLLAALCGAAGLSVVVMDDPLVTGAAAGAVVALLVGVGSRLALVREPKVVPMPAQEARPAGLERARSHASAS